MKPIVLKAKSEEEYIGVVRLSPEAERIVKRLRAKTCLSARAIVSEIIIQAEGLIEIEAAEEDE